MKFFVILLLFSTSGCIFFKDTSPQEKDTSSQKKDTSPQEKDTSSQEKDTSSQEKDTSSQEKDTSSQEKDDTDISYGILEQLFHKHYKKSKICQKIKTNYSNAVSKDKVAGETFRKAYYSFDYFARPKLSAEAFLSKCKTSVPKQTANADYIKAITITSTSLSKFHANDSNAYAIMSKATTDSAKADADITKAYKEALKYKCVKQVTACREAIKVAVNNSYAYYSRSNFKRAELYADAAKAYAKVSKIFANLPDIYKVANNETKIHAYLSKASAYLSKAKVLSGQTDDIHIGSTNFMYHYNIIREKAVPKMKKYCKYKIKEGS